MKNTNDAINTVNHQSSEEPEWGRLAYIESNYGIGRSTQYTLIEVGAIRSASLRLPGQTRATRLVNIQSVKDFIESCETQQIAS